MAQEPPNEHLVPTGNPGEEKLDLLKQWLSSHIKPTDFFETNMFELADLHTALRSAFDQIVDVLEIDLDGHMRTARDRGYNIEVDEEEMFATRDVDWDTLTYQEINGADSDKTIGYLRSARSEIAWLKEEISRLKMHKVNASIAMDANKKNRRESFSYHPHARDHEKKRDEEKNDAMKNEQRKNDEQK